jgi:hypothetical protein
VPNVHKDYCENYAFCYHAETGGDADCMCDKSPEEVAETWRARYASYDDDLLTLAEELGMDLNELR